MYKTTNMIIKNPIYLLSKNNATAVMKEIELFRHIKDCIGMFVPDSTYSNYVSLIIGYDLAKDNILLEGLRVVSF